MSQFHVETEIHIYPLKYMKKITKDLAVAGACHLPGWGPRDSPHQRLRTLQDMARNRQ